MYPPISVTRLPKHHKNDRYKDVCCTVHAWVCHIFFYLIRGAYHLYDSYHNRHTCSRYFSKTPTQIYFLLILHLLLLLWYVKEKLASLPFISVCQTTSLLICSLRPFSTSTKNIFKKQPRNFWVHPAKLSPNTNLVLTHCHTNIYNKYSAKDIRYIEA